MTFQRGQNRPIPHKDFIEPILVVMAVGMARDALQDLLPIAFFPKGSKIHDHTPELKEGAPKGRPKDSAFWRRILDEAMIPKSLTAPIG